MSAIIALALCGADPGPQFSAAAYYARAAGILGTDEKLGRIQ